MTTRDIKQSFWRSPALPFAELRSTHNSTQAYKLHRHAQFSLGAIVDGETHTLCNGENYHLHTGDLVLIAPEVAHSCNPVTGARSYHMLYLDNDWCLAQRGLQQGQISCTQTVIRDANLFAQFMQIVALMHDNATPALPDRLSALFMALPGISVSPADMNNPRSRDVLGRFSADLQTPPSLDELAGEFCLRKETLIRQMKQATGLTPGALLNNVRVEFAKTRLRAGEEITDVGYQSGFADQSHFHRTFVSYTASTPRQYARSISDNN